MKASTEKASNGEYFGIVTDASGKVIYKTLTTFFEKHYALARAKEWASKKQLPHAASDKKKPIQVGDTVSTPKGAGVLRALSANFAVVQISNAKHTFMTSQIKAL